jgi:molybdenum-dependent DNA-binding transcriptional regulator ModE
MDRLQTMQIYVNIVERGSFTQAAEALQLHRPAVTKAVQQLEAELGIRLLNRSTRRVSTTAEGEAFYQRCVQLLANVTRPLPRSRNSRSTGHSPKGVCGSNCRWRSPNRWSSPRCPTSSSCIRKWRSCWASTTSRPI